MSYSSWKDIKPQKGKQELAFSLLGKVDFMLWGGSRFGGKIQPNTSVVHTMGGTKKLGEVQVGDYILNPNGTNQRVIQVHPHLDHQFYKVTFDDGAITYCGMEHLWTCWRKSRVTKRGKSLDKKYGTSTPQDLYPNKAEVRDLAGIQEWIKAGYNVCIPVTKPLPYTLARKDHLDCYLLGVLLGDGCITKTTGINITNHKDDHQIIDILIDKGVEAYRINEDRLTIGFQSDYKKHLASKLEKYGLIGTYSDTKFIPDFYQYLPIPKRIELLQGLMDTDGYCDDRGHLEYSTVSKELSDGITKLVRGLGGKSTVNTKIGKYKDENGVVVECKLVYRHYLKMPSEVTPFKLDRKVARYVGNKSIMYRNIVSIEKSTKEDGRCITVSDPNSLYVTDDTIVTHNSELLSMIPLPFYKDPEFRGVYFRRTYAEITQSSGLWDKANSMYPLFKGKPLSSAMTWKFKSGAQVQYRHMQYEQDKENYRGSGQTLIAFDEIDKFSQDQVTFLMTCLRSKASVNSFMVGTLNPNPDSWCLPWVEYYLNEEGFPDEDKVGVIRHFIIKDDEIIFGESEEWFQENYPEALWVTDPTSETGKRYVRPKTFTFVFFNIFDNPLGLAENESYLSELNNLPDHERSTQLWGNWYSRPKGSSLWSREWILGENGEKAKRLSDIPPNIKRFRAWDKGYTEVSKENKQVDFTAASPQMFKDKDGFYWIVGNYVDGSYDDVFTDKKHNERIYGRFRKLAGARDNLILKQALHDGDDCSVVLTKDSGSGMTDHTYTVSKLVENSINVVVDKSPSNTPDKKLKDFQPFCNACSNGLVYIVPESFPNQKTLEAWLKEHENFDPTKRSTTARKDDWVDASASCFNAAAESKVIPMPKYAPITNKTMAADVLTNH